MAVVKLPDLNLLIYAADAQSPRHRGARQWLERSLSSEETIAFAWTVLLGFVRLTTHPGVFRQPLQPSAAVAIVDGWLRQPNTLTLNPTDRHLSLLDELLGGVGSAGNLVTDAHLAALAIEHGAELLSCDHDFARFPGLRWSDPLSG